MSVPEEIRDFFSKEPKMNIPDPIIRDPWALETAMGIMKVIKTVDYEEYWLTPYINGNILKAAERINSTGKWVSTAFITDWGRVGACALLDDEELDDTRCYPMTCNLFHQRVVLDGHSGGLEHEPEGRFRAALLRAYLIQDEEKEEENGTLLLPATLTAMLFDTDIRVLMVLAEYCDNAQILEALHERPILEVREIIEHRLECEFDALDHSYKPLDIDSTDLLD